MPGFQNRGTPHTHLVIWCVNAPVHVVDPDEEVIEFIDSFITADSSVVSPKLRNLQRHLHTQHCNGKRSVCAFGFPQPPLTESGIGCRLEVDIVTADGVQAATQDWRAIRNMQRSFIPLSKRARQGWHGLP